MRLTFLTQIRSVTQRQEVLSVHGKEPNVHIERGPAMWWLQIGLVSFNCGTEKPPFEPGQKIRLSIESEESNR